MFEVKDGRKTIYFTRQEDADNYNDYLQNGLKVIRADNRSYYFNNGDRLIDVSMQGEQKKRYVLHSGHRTITSERLQREYIKAISKQIDILKPKLADIGQSMQDSDLHTDDGKLRRLK